MLGSGGFDADIVVRYAHTVREALLHLGYVGFELGALGTYRCVDVAYVVAFRGYELHGTAKEYLAVYVLVLRACVGEMVSYVAHISRPEEGVADGVYEHVCVAVSEQTLGVCESDASEPQFPPFYKLVDIVSESYSDFHTFFLGGILVFHLEHGIPGRESYGLLLCQAQYVLRHVFLVDNDAKHIVFKPLSGHDEIALVSV